MLKSNTDNSDIKNSVGAYYGQARHWMAFIYIIDDKSKVPGGIVGVKRVKDVEQRSKKIPGMSVINYDIIENYGKKTTVDAYTVRELYLENQLTFPCQYDKDEFLKCLQKSVALEDEEQEKLRTIRKAGKIIFTAGACAVATAIASKIIGALVTR